MTISGNIVMAPISDSFRAKRQAWFLTYPRTPARLSPQAYLNKLPTICGEERFNLGLEDYYIAREEHPTDGENPFHLHVYLKFSVAIETENSRFWDLKFYNKVYHPNDGGAIRNPHRVLGYLQKDEVDSVTNMSPEKILPPLMYAAMHSKTDWDFWYSMFFQSSMKPGSNAAFTAARKLRTLAKNNALDFEEIYGTPQEQFNGRSFR